MGIEHSFQLRHHADLEHTTKIPGIAIELLVGFDQMHGTAVDILTQKTVFGYVWAIHHGS